MFHVVFLSLSLSLSLSLGADVTDYFNYGFTEETWKYYCEKQKKMRGEVTSLNKIVVSSLISRNLAWTNKWYSRSRPLHTLALATLVQVYIACTRSSSSVAVIVQFSYVMRYHVQCWLLFEIVMIKDDIDNGNFRPSILSIGNL